MMTLRAPSTPVPYHLLLTQNSLYGYMSCKTYILTKQRRSVEAMSAVMQGPDVWSVRGQ